VIVAVRQALDATRPARIVCSLDHRRSGCASRNLLSQRTLMEEALSALPVTFPAARLVHGKT